MFELVALILFVAAPWALGYVSGSYFAALLPAAVLMFAVAAYPHHPPQNPDETDVLPGLFLAASAVAVVVCVAAAAVRRRRARRPA